MGKRRLINNARSGQSDADKATRPSRPVSGGGTRKKRRGVAPLTNVRIERVALSAINPAAYNPRKDLQPGDPEYEKLARSVDEFGLVEPLVWNKRTGNLVGGHQRLKVLAARGVTGVHVSVVDLPPARERALNVALNKIAGDWDTDRLATLLGELRQDETIDETLTGFDQLEIAAMLAEVNAGEQEPDTSPQLGALQYRLVVECRDEQHQRELLMRLEKQGFKCQVLIS
jgi:ParB-like chromosome segregation protein Spo0J